jgi:septum formation protein
MLRAAGVDFAVEPANIDEVSIKQGYRAKGGSAEACAVALAQAKAGAVARRYPTALVIGADQILVEGDEWFDKPSDQAAAAAQLRRLAGRTHALETAACVMQNEQCLWSASSRPKLAMRRFSDAFLTGYIAAEGAAVLGSVGAYRIEGRGVQLFDAVEGDHFAILGLPLIEMLGFLRSRGVVGK